MNLDQKTTVFAGCAAGLIGAAALLLGVQPTTGFFLVMGASIAILALVIEVLPTGTAPDSETVAG
jgi:hypothetical protein